MCVSNVRLVRILTMQLSASVTADLLSIFSKFNWLVLCLFTLYLQHITDRLLLTVDPDPNSTSLEHKLTTSLLDVDIFLKKLLNLTYNCASIGASSTIRLIRLLWHSKCQWQVLIFYDQACSTITLRGTLIMKGISFYAVFEKRNIWILACIWKSAI